jgi:asparagine synthase (glutamine-hydrolysing)
MCGITGILNLKEPRPTDQSLLVKMLAVIRHRGPDESGIYLDPYIGMGQVRLSIIGIEDGTPPICNEDGSLWIVYNGETFNFIELKEELLKKGHVFSTSTDTEVVLHLYEEFGPACLEKINGQFALAIWDSRKKELFLARDRVGIRPLFYWQAKDRLIFASEVKSIFMHPDVSRDIDLQALQQVFTFWTTVTPKTIFKGIFELPPGHYMTVKAGKISCKAFWNIPYYEPRERETTSFGDVREELQSLLQDAVRIRLRADVPVGAYASGGLDSSVITALISKKFNNRLNTFSIGFEEKGFDERLFQKALVEHLGTEHHQAHATNLKIRDHFMDVIWHCERPLLRTAPVPLFLLSKLVRDKQFKVVLTGEGADEIFAGYNIFKEAKVRQFWARQPTSRLRPLLLERLYPYIFNNPSRTRSFFQKFYAVKPGDLNHPSFSHQIRWRNTQKNSMFFSDPVADALAGYHPVDELMQLLPEGFDSRDMLSKAQFLEMSIFLSNYLLSSQGDRVAMAHSLEIRLPFLDYRLIDFAFRLPAKWKINGLEEKYILKHSFNGMVPESIKNRTKQPYRAPIREVFFGDDRGDAIREILSEENLKKAGLFNIKKVTGLVKKYRNTDISIDNEVQNMAIVGILSTQLLYRQFIENFPWKPVELFQPDKIVKKD